MCPSKPSGKTRYIGTCVLGLLGLLVLPMIVLWAQLEVSIVPPHLDGMAGFGYRPPIFVLCVPLFYLPCLVLGVFGSAVGFGIDVVRARRAQKRPQEELANTQQWYRFKRRTVFMVMAAVALLIGLANWRVRCLLNQREAIRLANQERAAAMPFKLMQWTYAQYEQKEGRIVSVSYTQDADGAIRSLAGYTLPTVTSLGLHDSKVSDGSLNVLKFVFPNLERLEIDSVMVTDAGLASVRELKHLRSVFLVNTKVTDAGISELRKALPGTTIERRP
jgi:hypothetical protein